MRDEQLDSKPSPFLRRTNSKESTLDQLIKSDLFS